MITDTFDSLSPAIINPVVKDDAVEVDACLTFMFSMQMMKRFST